MQIQTTISTIADALPDYVLQHCQHKDWLCLDSTQTACRHQQPSEALPTPLLLSCICRSGQSEGLPYGEKCLFVANDWHAALVPSFLAAKYRRNGVYTDARSIVAIHNMSHQGVEPSSFFGRLGLPGDWWAALTCCCFFFRLGLRTF